MAFKKWKDSPEIQDAVLKLTESAKKFSVLTAENTTESKSLVINHGAGFDVKAWLASKCAGDIFPVMTFSDYISESWASITGNEAPVPAIGMTLDDSLICAQMTDAMKRSELKAIIMKKRGYRILPSETRKVLVNMFRPKAEE